MKNKKIANIGTGTWGEFGTTHELKPMINLFNMWMFQDLCIFNVQNLAICGPDREVLKEVIKNNHDWLTKYDVFQVLKRDSERERETVKFIT